MSKPRVIIADDHAMVGEALADLLSAECDVIATVRDGRALLAAVARLRPDVVVLDISMPLLNGLDAARLIKRSHPSVRLVFVTMNEDPELAAQALRIGGASYVSKRSAASELITAIREAMAQRSYITPLVTDGMLDWLRQSSPDSAAHDLTTRQREVLQLLAEGKSMKEVSAILDVALRTVALHKYQLMEQLRVKTSAELVQYAIRHRVI